MTKELMIPLIGLSQPDKLTKMYEAASEQLANEHLDWPRKEELEKEALIWVQMYEWAGHMEEEVFTLQGKILAHIQNHDLLRHHPGRTNWGSLNEMIADRISSTALSPSQRSDMAFIVEDVMPVIEKLGITNETAPSLSVVRTLVPAIRIAMRRHDDEGLKELLMRGSLMTVDQAQALASRPEPQAEGVAIATSPTSPISCHIVLTPAQFARLRRSCPWIDWDLRATRAD